MNNIIKLFICLLLICYFLFLTKIYIFYKNECNSSNNIKNNEYDYEYVYNALIIKAVCA
jgi:hypothetical protein